MEFITVIKAITIWFVILLLAIVNGGLREAVLIPKIGLTPGLILSGLLLSILILMVTYVALPWLNVQQTRQLIAIGLGWLLLTLVFNFLLVYFVACLG